MTKEQVREMVIRFIREPSLGEMSKENLLMYIMQTVGNPTENYIMQVSKTLDAVILDLIKSGDILLVRGSK